MKKWLLALVACLILVAAPTASARILTEEIEIFSDNGLIAGVSPFDGYPDVAHITIFGFAEAGSWRPSGGFHQHRLTGPQDWEMRTGLTVCGSGVGYWGGMGVLVDVNNYATGGLMKDSGFAKDPDKLHLVVSLRRDGVEQLLDYGPIESRSYECGAAFAPMYRLYALYHPITRRAEFGVLEDSGRRVVASGILNWIDRPLPVWFGAGKGEGDYISVDHAGPNVWLAESN